MINIKNFIDSNTLENLVIGTVKNPERISTDTRTLLEGDCFLALSGENFDGNKYLEAAIEKGAKGCIHRNDEDTKRSVDKLSTKYPEVYFVGVDNPEKYFQALAKYHHQEWRRSGETITIGITGSNGKTTTKELLAGILEDLFPGKILFTQGNLNNHLGVPMTMLRLKEMHTVCILEIGTNHPGEISFLCDLGDPEAGIITTIGQSHLEFFHNEENVFKEKRSLFDHVNNKKGKFSVDYDNDFLRKLESSDHLMKLGYENGGDVKLSLKGRELGFEGRINLTLEAPYLMGEHNFKNLSLVVGLLISLYPEKETEIIKSCKTLKLPNNNRSEMRRVGNVEYFLDAYNANPSSMIASLKMYFESLGEKGLAVTDALFVLGDMNELGERSPDYHREIGSYLNQQQVSSVVFVGRFSQFYKEGFGKDCLVFESTDELKKEWSSVSKGYSEVFLKGSRTLQLESLVAQN